MTMTENPTTVRSTDRFEMIHLGLLVPDPKNVRDELTDIEPLAESILLNGLQQPLRVRLQPTGYFEEDPGCAVYVVMAGHRRLAAIKSLGEMWQGEVPCMVAPDGISTDDVTAAMLVENLQRADLNCVEEARAFEQLTKDFDWTKEDIAAKISRSVSYVRDRLDLLRLPESVIESVRVGFYPMTSALLLKAVDHDIIDRITKGGRVVVQDYTIQSAVREAKFKKIEAAAKAKFAELVEGGLAQLDNSHEWWSFTKKSKEYASADTLTAIKKLSVDQLPKKAVGRLDVRPYAGEASIEIRVPLTPGQLTKLEEKEIAEQEAAEAAERATMTPEYLAWLDAKEQIETANLEVTAAWEDAVRQAKKAWASTIPAKTAAQLAMKYVGFAPASYASLDWERRKALELLGAVRSHATSNEVAEALAEFCSTAQNLSAVVALTLLNTKHALALDEFEKFAAKHEISLTAPEQAKVPKAPRKYLDDPIVDEAGADVEHDEHPEYDDDDYSEDARWEGHDDGRYDHD